MNSITDFLSEGWKDMLGKDDDHDCHIDSQGTGHCGHPSHPDYEPEVEAVDERKLDDFRIEENDLT